MLARLLSLASLQAPSTSSRPASPVNEEALAVLRASPTLGQRMKAVGLVSSPTLTIQSTPDRPGLSRRQP